MEKFTMKLSLSKALSKSNFVCDFKVNIYICKIISMNVEKIIKEPIALRKAHEGPVIGAK